MIKSIKNLTPRLAEIGKIKIGGKSLKKITTKSKKVFQPPVKFDHFVITKLTRDGNSNLIKDEKVMAKLGNNSRELPIVLLYDDTELNFPTSYALYAGRSCRCRGNGIVAERDNGEVACNPKECKWMIEKKCKPNGVLSAIIPYAQKVGGVYKFRTTSWNSVQNILSAIEYIKMQTGGKIAGIPLKLEMEKKHTEAHGNVETVNLVYDGSENKLQQASLLETKRRETYKLNMKEYEQLAIESGVTDDNDDPQEIEDEFYHEDKKITNESRGLALDADDFIIEKKETLKKVEPVAKKKVCSDNDSVADEL